MCPVTSGSVAPCFLELFERVTGEPFSETPGALLTNRVRAIAKVLGNLVREVTFTPPLLQGRQRAYVCWNRCPRERVEMVVWRRRVEATEEFRAPPPRTRTVRASIDAELAGIIGICGPWSWTRARAGCHCYCCGKWTTTARSPPKVMAVTGPPC